MKIALIANYRPEHSFSMLGYAAMLQSGLQSRGHQVEIVDPPVVFGRLAVGDGEFAKWIGYIDKYLLGPGLMRRKIRRFDPDIVHVCDHSNSMHLRCAADKPQVITCHDLIAINGARGRYPGLRTRFTGRLQQAWIAHGLARARHVICDSHKTASDFRENFPASQAEIRVIHLGLNRAFYPAPAAEIQAALAALGLPAETPYLLHVGHNSWYKNRRGAMQIYASLRQFPEFQSFMLVMVGAPWSAPMRAFCAESKLNNRVVEARSLPDSTLNALYSGAAALLFPSREEGFGWPILEAQACGCPVITTKRPPMTEIAGDAAIFIDPSEPRLAAQTIRDQWSRRAQLRESGFRNVERFSPDAMLDACRSAYESIVASER